MNERMNSAEAAEYLRLKENTLAVWRSTKHHPQPAYIKIGSKVVYLKRDLDAYIESCRVCSVGVA